MQKKLVRGKGLVRFGKRDNGSSRERSQCLRLRGRKGPAMLEELKTQKGKAVTNNRIRMGHRLRSYDIFVGVRISYFIHILKGKPLLVLKWVEMIQFNMIEFIISVCCEKKAGDKGQKDKGLLWLRLGLALACVLAVTGLMGNRMTFRYTHRVEIWNLM